MAAHLKVHSWTLGTLLKVESRWQIKLSPTFQVLEFSLQLFPQLHLLHELFLQFLCKFTPTMKGKSKLLSRAASLFILPQWRAPAAEPLNNNQRLARGRGARRQNKRPAKSPHLSVIGVFYFESPLVERTRISGAFTVSANSHLTAFPPAAAAVIAEHRPELETIIIMESQGFSKRCKIISWRASGLWLRSLKY